MKSIPMRHDSNDYVSPEDQLNRLKFKTTSKWKGLWFNLLANNIVSKIYKNLKGQWEIFVSMIEKYKSKIQENFQTILSEEKGPLYENIEISPYEFLR